MSFKIAVLGGDCVGPEVTIEAQRALEAVSERFGHDFRILRDNIREINIDTFVKIRE